MQPIADIFLLSDFTFPGRVISRSALGGWEFVQGTGRRAQSTGHRAQGAEHGAQGTEHGAQGTGLRAKERYAVFNRTSLN